MALVRPQMLNDKILNLRKSLKRRDKDALDEIVMLMEGVEQPETQTFEEPLPTEDEIGTDILGDIEMDKNMKSIRKKLNTKENTFLDSLLAPPQPIDEADAETLALTEDEDILRRNLGTGGGNLTPEQMALMGG